MSICLAEIKAQIAVGSTSKWHEVAALVKASDDPKAIMWASQHKYAQVRVVSSQSPLLPFPMLLKLYIVDPSKKVREICRDQIKFRSVEFEHLMEILQEFPQLSLQLLDKRTVPVVEAEDAGDNTDV